jgi:hypothetical protein
VAERTPDPDKYEVLDVEEVGHALVLLVKYPSCKRCSFEGDKILVYQGVKLKEVVLWKRIDPHFGDPTMKRTPTEAPSPSARFPASPEGWKHAMAYARFLNA